LLGIENQETLLYVVSHYPLATYYVGSKVLTAGKDQIIVLTYMYSEAEKKSLEYLSPE